MTRFENGFNPLQIGELLIRISRYSKATARRRVSIPFRSGNCSLAVNGPADQRRAFSFNPLQIGELLISCRGLR